MTDLHKRSMLKAVAFTAVAAAALAGCGKKEEAKPAEAPKPVASAPAPAKPEPLKVAFAYVGPVGDGGWTFAHDNGRKAVAKPQPPNPKPQTPNPKPRVWASWVDFLVLLCGFFVII